MKETTRSGPSVSPYPPINLQDSLGHQLPLQNCSIDDRQEAMQEMLQMLVDTAANLPEVWSALRTIIGKRHGTAGEC